MRDLAGLPGAGWSRLVPDRDGVTRSWPGLGGGDARTEVLVRLLAVAARLGVSSETVAARAVIEIVLGDLSG